MGIIYIFRWSDFLGVAFTCGHNDLFPLVCTATISKTILISQWRDHFHVHCKKESASTN